MKQPTLDEALNRLFAHLNVVAAKATKAPRRPTPSRDRFNLPGLAKVLLSKFPDLPLPGILIQAETKMRKVRGSYVCAQARGSSLIEFNYTYLRTTTEADVIDTMTHELLHCWINYHNFKDTSSHGDRFETAAKLLGIKYYSSWREDDKAA